MTNFKEDIRREYTIKNEGNEERNDQKRHFC